MIQNLTSLEMANQMGNGTNLANTMEAYGHFDLGSSAEVIEYETFWGMPRTEKELFTDLVDAGFDSLRIPVSWTNMMPYEDNDFTIHKAYLNRVGELVRQAIDAGLIVIVNDHWDGGWTAMFGSSDPMKKQKALDMYRAIWTQVGEYFKDFPYELILESANEEFGRSLNETYYYKDSGNLTIDEEYEITNQMNQMFVDLIRSMGSNNKDRFLLIAGFNTDFRDTVDERYKMPIDSAQDKLLLSVHYYTPWPYCGTTQVDRWGSVADLQEQNDLFQLMTKYSNKGIGIIIGEFGVALDEHLQIKEDAPLFIKNILDNCDLYGYVPMLWDTNHYFKREKQKILHEEIASLYQQRRNQARINLSIQEIQTQAKQSLENTLKQAFHQK